MTTFFIWKQIDMELNDLMLELSKQLTDIVKSIVHNKIQVAQQQANTKDNSIWLCLEKIRSMGMSWLISLGGNLFNYLIGNTDRSV